MYRIGNLYYWFRESGGRFTKRGYYGPQYAAIVMKDGSLIDFDFFNHNDANKVSTINAEDAAGMIVLAPKDNTWSIECTNELSGNNIYGSGYASKDEAAKELLRRKSEAEAEEQQVRDDPVRYLERELSRCDWTSHYADDYRSWAAGEAHMKLIRELIEKVPENIAKELWTKYAPQGSECPG